MLSTNTVRFDPPIRYNGTLESLLNNIQPGGQNDASASPKKSKIIILNPNQVLSNGDSSKGSSNGKHETEAVPKPKIVFFNPNEVMVGYREHRSAGAGMWNIGNTCYLNSTLQALFHTPAMYNYLLNNSAKHLAKCNQARLSGNYGGDCILCSLTSTLRETLKISQIKPDKIFYKLKNICKHMIQGRQEDAHEFLRYLIEALERSFLLSEKVPIKSLDNASKETTPFNQIFGGYMRQDVTCMRCKYVSTTIQHFMDLLLDIRQVSNIHEALEHHFRPERIGETSDCMYKCERCKIKVLAKKTCMIQRPPAVLCIQLKRFNLLGGKISKPVQLSKVINMSQFIHTSTRTDVNYKLVSMITHVGPSPNCGHYTAIGEAGSGQFFQFDDSSVRQISEGQALNTASYVVFYEMTPSCWEQQVRMSNISKLKRTEPPRSRPPPTQNGASHSTTIANLNITPTPPHIPSFNRPKVISETSTTSSLNGITLIKPQNGLLNQQKPVNKFGVVASIKKPLSMSSIIVKPVNAATQKPVNGLSIGKKGLVDYDSDSESTEKQSNLEDDSKMDPAKQVVRSPFVPRAVTINGLKKTRVDEKISVIGPQLNDQATYKSSSGNWTVTDVDHHNPSVKSDGSGGSSTAWTVTTVKQVDTPPGTKHSELAATSPWVVTPISKSSPTDSDSNKMANFHKSESSAAKDPSVIINKAENSDLTKKYAAVPSENTSILKDESSRNVKVTNPHYEKLEIPQEKPRPQIVREPFCPDSLSRKRGSLDNSDGEDDYDADQDRGRTKKVKKSNMDRPLSPRRDSNPFQSAQKRDYKRRNSDFSNRDKDRFYDRSIHRSNYDKHRSRSHDDYGRSSYSNRNYRDSHHNRKYHNNHFYSRYSDSYKR